MSELIWKDLPGSEGVYRISTKGDCFSYYKNALMEKDIIESGHIQYWTRFNGKSKPTGAHVLVALTFIPKPDELKDLPMSMLVVHHKDGNPQNNDVDNLCWMTKQKHQELHCGIPVYQYTKKWEFVRKWPTGKAVEHETGRLVCNINKCCNYEAYSAYDYFWSFLPPEELIKTHTQIIEEFISPFFEIGIDYLKG